MSIESSRRLGRVMNRMRELVSDVSLFADAVTYYPQGDKSNGVPLTGDVSWADEAGDNAVRGDGRSSLNQGRGRKVRNTVTIEVTSEMSFSENGRDLFLIKDEDGSDVIVKLQRRDGTDSSTQTLVCVRAQELASQPGRREG